MQSAVLVATARSPGPHWRLRPGASLLAFGEAAFRETVAPSPPEVLAVGRFVRAVARRLVGH